MQRDAKVEQKLAHLVKESQSQRLFSHCYLSAGDLKTKTLKLEVIAHPDEAFIYDLSSLSKALATGALFWQLVFKKKFRLEDTTRDILSQIRTNCDLNEFSHLLGIKLRDFLSHESGLPFWCNFYVCRLNAQQSLSENLREPQRRDWILKRFKNVSVSKEVLHKVVYSDVNFILLGVLLELYLEQRLDVSFAHLLDKTLNLDTKLGKHIGFVPQLNELSALDFIGTGHCPLRQRETKGEVHDENCAALGQVSGHSGLFSSGPALNEYLFKLFASDFGNDYFQTNARSALEGSNALLAFRKGDDPVSSCFANKKAFGHWGFTGTALWICPKTFHYVLILTNRVRYERIPGVKIKEFRTQVLRLVDEAAF